MCYFFLLIFFSTVMIISLSNIVYRNSMNSQQDAYTSQMVKQISSNVDYNIKNAENIIDYLSQDPRIIKFMSVKQNDSGVDEIKNDAYKAILSYTGIHPEIAGIMAVNKNDIYASDVMSRESRDPLIHEKWYEAAEKNSDKVQLFSKPIGRNIYNIFRYSADDVVSISKAVVAKNSTNCCGVILIDMKLDLIKNIIDNVKSSKTGFIYILDPQGNIVYSPVNTVIYRIKNEWFKFNRSSILIKNINGKMYKIINYNSKYTKWNFVGVFPLDESLKTIAYIGYYSFFIAVITLALGVILSIFLSKSIVKPISKLRKLMMQTEKGNFDVCFNSKYNDEIGQLGNTFNNMVKKIKDLINIVQIEEKNKRKAEIGVLQAQIKPHFLYNTLDTIQWMAQEHDADDISEMVYNLTNLLRIGLSKGREIIKIEKEVEHVKSYLVIQKVRYEDKLNYDIDVDKDIMDCNVIKLILQPLVENAIYHGIKEKRGPGKIKVAGYAENGMVHFKVLDNGIGMKKDKLNEINRLLKENFLTNASEKIGYGIFNVNERIKMNYGSKYGLSYASIYGKGTEADIWIPQIREKENNI